MAKARAVQNQHPLNLAILIVSACAAIACPLQTFLLAYAILGPIHYLTEIAWLRRKNFYLATGGLIRPKAFLWLSVLLCLVACLDFHSHRGFTADAVGVLLVLSFGALDFGAEAGRAAHLRTLVMIAGALAFMWLTRYFIPGYGLFLAAFVPTVVHVYVFTLVFLLSGLRSLRRPLLGWLNAALLLVIPIALLGSGRLAAGNSPAIYWLRSEAFFVPMHQYIGAMLGMVLHFQASGPIDSVTIALFRALAFIYLHHYLNWFAKTELLEWHRLSRPAWAVIVAVYVVSIGLYAYSFALGFYAAFFLSLLHVVLELPLDWRAAASMLGHPPRQRQSSLAQTPLRETSV